MWNRKFAVISIGAISSVLRTLGLLFSAALLASGTPDNSSEKAKSLRQSGKLNEARLQLNRLLADSGTQELEKADAYSELSQIELAEGHYPAALDDCQRALPLFRGAHDKAGEGTVLTVSGLAKLYTGNYSEALSDLGPALTIARETHDAAAEVTRLNNIGTVFYFQGDYGNAMRRYENAMTVVDGHVQESWNLSRRQLTTANIATVYQRLGRYSNALDTYQTLRKAGNALPPSEEAQLLANMGALYRRLGDPVKALEMYRAARQLYSSRTMRNGEIAVLNNIGIAQALDLKLYSAALTTFDQAVAMAAQSGDRPVQMHASLYRGETFYRMRKPEQSQTEFAKAYDAASLIHASEEQWKALFGMARNNAEAGKHGEAVAQLHQAAGLIESLRGSGPLSLRGGFLADKRQVYDLLIEQTLQDTAINPATWFSLIEKTHSRALQDANASAGGQSLERLQRTLPAGTLLLDYWLDEDAAVVVWATSAKAGVHIVRDQHNLRSRLQRFAAALMDVSSETWSEEARIFGRMLLPPEVAAAGIRRVVVVPDRELAAIPFEVFVLPGTTARPLLDHASVTYSRAGVPAGPARRHRTVWPFWKSTVLAFGNPSRGTGEDLISLPSAGSQGSLAGASAEVEDVARLVGGRSALYTGRNARKEILTRFEPKRMPVLHFATHAFSDLEEPARSYILLAPERSTGAYDYLFLKEAAALNLRDVDLVTISTCESARGKLTDGEAIESFEGAFLDAGAKAVVASMWPVGDEATRQFMHQFYTSLGNGQPVAEALRLAKLNSLKNGRAHPFYWAGFVVGGDGEVQLPYVVSAVVCAAGLLGFLGVLTLATAAIARQRRTSLQSKTEV